MFYSLYVIIHVFTAQNKLSLLEEQTVGTGNKDKLRGIGHNSVILHNAGEVA